MSEFPPYLARKPGLFWSVIVLIIILMLLLLRTSSAGAGSTFYYSLLAATMSPGDSTIQYDNFSTAFLTTTANSSIPGNVTGYNGQINLPDGSTITGMGCEGKDTDPNNEFQIFMSRFSIDNSPIAWEIISSGASSGISFEGGKTKITGIVATDHGQQIVNNAVWSYNIFVSLPKANDGTTLGVLRCWVSSTYPVNLPIVRR
jgi:hypothetical protein